MSKITIFQHLVQNASRIIWKRGNNDVEFEAMIVSLFAFLYYVGYALNISNSKDIIV